MREDKELVPRGKDMFEIVNHPPLKQVSPLPTRAAATCDCSPRLESGASRD